MNIKFGMNNFYVRYLKRFLNNELKKNTNILGKFDKEDLKNLIQYLNLPNVETMFDVRENMAAKFPKLEQYFYVRYGNDVITYTSKQLSQTTSQYIMDKMNDIEEYAKSMGWVLDSTQEWLDTNKDINGDGVVDDVDGNIISSVIRNPDDYSEDIKKKCDINLDGVVTTEDLTMFNDYYMNTRLSIVLAKSNRENYFPNKDMLIFVNQFMGDFIYGYTIKGGGGFDGTPHKDIYDLHKLAIFECKPGQKLTIAHNSINPEPLVIGCSSAKLKNNIKITPLSNVVALDGDTNPMLRTGEGYQYTCSETAHWLVIQLPSNHNAYASAGVTKTSTLMTGDINFDGKIDMLDYHMLAQYTATGPGATELPMNKANWTPTPRQLAVMNVNKDIYGVTNDDAILMYQFLTGQSSLPSLGLTNYVYKDLTEIAELDNVDNLLIIEGHYYNHNINTDEYEDGYCVNGDVNIPFNEFVENDWVIHEKFFNYLLGMAIHKYSDSDTIAYLQKLLKAYYPQARYDDHFFNVGEYNDIVKTLVKDFQKSNVYYTYGDLNLDGKIDQADVDLLETYVQDTVNFRLCEKYIKGEIELTDAQKAAIDMEGNNDGFVNSIDYELIKSRIYGTYSDTFRKYADINRDSIVDENDLAILKQIVEQGESSIVNLSNYTVTFMLGWYDVQTEAMLEYIVNLTGDISEVSK